MKSSIFLISLNLSNPLRKTISTQTYSKNHQKIYKTPYNIDSCFKNRVLDCLKRERDICTKPVLSGAKMPFRLTPALMC